MKTRQDFGNTINGKTGEAFIDSIVDFMDKHDFQMNIFNTLYEDEILSILFLTDHISNDYGIFFVEASTPFIFVAEKKKIKQDIFAFLAK